MIKIFSVQSMDIEQQLTLEENILNNRKENYCIVNLGSPTTRIVFGLSTKNIEDFVYKERIPKGLKYTKRISGGGVVLVDQNTIFVTFVCNKGFFNSDHNPTNIHDSLSEFYKSALNIEGFESYENDYTITKKKIGGTAQYIKANRFLHHTSFLYDYNPKKMNYLKIPEKQPTYRFNRPHDKFLTKLKNIVNKETFKNRIINKLSSRFETETTNLLS